MSYFTLLFNEGPHLAEPWGITFGDYDREVVAQELEDLRESWDAPRRSFKIVRTETDLQAEIDAVVAQLNAEARP